MSGHGGGLGRSVVVELVAERERASATPVARDRGARSAPPPPGERGGPRPPQPRDGAAGEPAAGAEPRVLRKATLRERQLWFENAVTSTRPDDDDDADAILTAGPRLSAGERLDVYRRAYSARLVECLADDYPALRAALGEEAFERLCREYIVRHPSTSPSLNAYGRRMAEVCRQSPGPSFPADLAALEWAIVEVIHAPSAAPLTPSGLADVPVEQWAEARLETTPAFRLLRFDYPVNAYFQAFRQGEAPAIPSVASSAAAVYRSGPTVWRMDLSDAMAELLRRLASGETLGSALERAAAAFAETDEEVAIRRVMGWFREWVSGGLFSQVKFG